MYLVIRDLKTNVDQTYTLDDIHPHELLKNGTNFDITFVTSSSDKLRELSLGISKIKKNIKIYHEKIDLVEIQHSDSLKIIELKCIEGFKRSNFLEKVCNRYLLIEDTCLEFHALNGLPGPYIKWFVDAIGPEGLYQMLEGFEDKTANAVCTYGLMDRNNFIYFCVGKVSGKIVKPRGMGWGWDSCFEEATTGKTFGEMDAETKLSVSHRMAAQKVLFKLIK